MGLDQYWFIRTENKNKTIKNDSEFEYEEIGYHRKVPALQEFMANIWAKETGNSADEFNCEHLVVTKEILKQLEEACKSNGAGLNKEASGFFWGGHYDEDIPEIKKAIKKVKEAIKDGQTVTYSSWW